MKTFSVNGAEALFASPVEADGEPVAVHRHHVAEFPVKRVGAEL